MHHARRVDIASSFFMYGSKKKLMLKYIGRFKNNIIITIRSHARSMMIVSSYVKNIASASCIV